MAWKYTSNRYLRDWNAEQFPDWWPRPFKGKAHITGWLNRGTSVKALRGSWDLFHPTYFDPYFLPELRGRPFVLTIHDMTHELYPAGLSDRSFLPERKKRLAQRATKVIAVSENTRQDAIRLLSLDPNKVVTVHHGNSLQPGSLKPVRPSRDQDYWLYVGARGAYKNWTQLVRALGLRRDTRDSLVMVGGGPLSGEERAELQAAGLADRWQQTAASDAELAGWYASAKALVYPSRYEGFGFPLLEAMAWGCPVVAARASCLPEIGAEAAVYFELDEPDSLVAALRAVEQAETRRLLVQHGLERSSQFSWTKMVEQTRAVYRSCL